MGGQPHSYSYKSNISHYSKNTESCTRSAKFSYCSCHFLSKSSILLRDSPLESYFLPIGPKTHIACGLKPFWHIQYCKVDTCTNHHVYLFISFLWHFILLYHLLLTCAKCLGLKFTSYITINIILFNILAWQSAIPQLGCTSGKGVS
jgi:hypothetical protein